MMKTARAPIPVSVRNYVYQRDNCRCRSCGKREWETRLSIDHIIPLALGGSNDLSNLQTLCLDCNQRKKHHLDPRFKQHFSD